MKPRRNIPTPPFWHAWQNASHVDEEFEERAAIMEYEAGLSRPKAEARAYRWLVVKYRGVNE